MRIGRAGTSEGARTTPIPMPDGIRVTLRIADLVYPTGDSTLQPDLVLTNESGTGEGGIRAAIEASRRPAPKRKVDAAAPVLQGQKDNPYPSMPFPSEESGCWRSSATGTSSTTSFPTSTCSIGPGARCSRTSFRASRPTRQRSITRRRSPRWSSACRIRTGPRADCRRSTIILGHSRPGASGVRRRRARGGRGARQPRRADGAGLAPGDVILAIDGAPVAERLAALSRLRALSTPQAAYAFVYPAMLRGAQGQSRHGAGAAHGRWVRDVMLARSRPLARASTPCCRARRPFTK